MTPLKLQLILFAVQLLFLLWSLSTYRKAKKLLAQSRAYAYQKLQQQKRKGSNPPAPGPRPDVPPNPPLPPDPFEWDPSRGPGVKVYTADGTCYELRDIERACRVHHALRTMAAAGGWTPDDSEGLIEFVTRRHYEQGVADARSNPLSHALGELVVQWEEKARASKLESRSIAFEQCIADARNLLPKP